jgi:hypothetical protein
VVENEHTNSPRSSTLNTPIHPNKHNNPPKSANLDTPIYPTAHSCRSSWTPGCHSRHGRLNTHIARHVNQLASTDVTTDGCVLGVHWRYIGGYNGVKKWGFRIGDSGHF